MNVFALLKNLTKPGYARVILNKIRTRIRPVGGQEEALSWYQQQAIDLAAIEKKLDPVLLEEALTHQQDQRIYAQSILSQLPVKLGGGGFSALLFYLTRAIRPGIVVETGVAAGFSSHTFLTALHHNQYGHLFSSDFPYFRLADPEQYVGILVPDPLKIRWSLFTQGDEQNLPAIVAQLQGRSIDLLHYDSDKSVSGRSWALAYLKPYFSPDVVIVFDDVNDNPHFRDWVGQEQLPFRLFAWNKKIIGVVALRKAVLDQWLPGI